MPQAGVESVRKKVNTNEKNASAGSLDFSGLLSGNGDGSDARSDLSGDNRKRREIGFGY